MKASSLSGWINRYKSDVFLTLLIVLLAIAVFTFFKTFLNPEASPLTTEILAALLGSILTVMITMLLIKRQGSIEQAQETAATSKTKVFEKKLELFRDFIAIFVQSAYDGKLSQEELGKLEELALTISLFTKEVPFDKVEDDLGEEICRYILQLELLGLKTELEEKDYPVYDKFLSSPKLKTGHRHLLSFTYILRLMKVDLGIAQSEIGEPDASILEIDEYDWTRRLLKYRIENASKKVTSEKYND